MKLGDHKGIFLVTKNKKAPVQRHLLFAGAAELLSQDKLAGVAEPLSQDRKADATTYWLSLRIVYAILQENATGNLFSVL